MRYGKTSEYWDDRALETEAAAQQYADQAVSAACEGLSEARDYILKKIRSIYARFHKLTGLTMEQVRSLLTQEELQESNADLENLLPYLKKDSRQALLALLDRRAFSYRLDQLTDLLQAIEWVLKAAGQRIEDAGILALKEAMEDSYMRTLYAVQRGAGLWWPSPKYNDRRIQKAIDTPWLGSNYSQRVWTNVDKTARQAQTAVIAGMSAGMSQRDMRDTLIRLIGDGGVQPRYGAMARANTLIRSEVSHLSAQAQMDGYQESGISRYIFLATLDGVTCLTCQPLDGKNFPVEEASTGENLPPLHPRCRCTTKPYISGRDYSKMKRRARDPETGKTYLVPADVTYEEWKRDFVEGAAIWKASAQDTDGPAKSSDKSEDSSGDRNFSLKQNSDYRKEDGSFDLDKAKEDYRNFLTGAPEKNKMYLEQSMDSVTYEDHILPLASFGYLARFDTVYYDTSNPDFWTNRFSVANTHELAHRIDHMFVSSRASEKFSKSIQNAAEVIRANPQKFVDFCKEYDKDGFLSDTFDAICESDFKFPMGHGKEYWTGDGSSGRKEEEIFSNLFSLESFRDQEKIDFFKKIFPDIWKEFSDFLPM